MGGIATQKKATSNILLQNIEKDLENLLDNLRLKFQE